MGEKKIFFEFFTWGEFAFEKMKNFQNFAKKTTKKRQNCLFFQECFFPIGRSVKKKNDPSKTKFMFQKKKKKKKIFFFSRKKFFFRLDIFGIFRIFFRFLEGENAILPSPKNPKKLKNLKVKKKKFPPKKKIFFFA